MNFIKNSFIGKAFSAAKKKVGGAVKTGAKKVFGGLGNLLYGGSVGTLGLAARQTLNANTLLPRAGLNGLSNFIIYPGQKLKVSGSVSTGGGQSSSNNTGSYTPPMFYHQNLYDWGQCTWHVFNRRAETGKPISTYWWNADHWASNAAADGYTVNNTPTAGSIMQNYEGPIGHVAYVEQVNPDGSILISEMNYNTPPGTVDYRTIPASQASSYNYIH